MTATDLSAVPLAQQLRAALAATPLPLVINGQEVAGSGEKLPVTDPSTGQLLTETTAATAADIDRAVAAARAAFE
ncbi:MAG: aldehyde dehydrogenase family protein, partial [Glutamicibacter sp.]